MMRKAPGVRALLPLLMLTSAVVFGQEQWKGNIDWAIANRTSDAGQTNCPDQYAVTEPACILGGGRACLMQRAIDSAKHNNYDYAFQLTLITQCHNGGARQTIGAAAGKQAVGDYLKTK